MNHSMINSLVSMQGLQQKLDVIAGNMANMNTNGYKRREATFHDVLTSALNQPESFRQPGRLTPLGMTQNWGAKLSQIQIQMSQGSLLQTDLSTDLAIEGDALFEVATGALDENGQAVADRTGWTRHGAFSFKQLPGDLESVYLTTPEGYLVIGTDDQPIRVPNNHRIAIDPEGTVTAYNDRMPELPPVQAGQLKLVQVMRPQYLQSVGDHMFTLPDQMDPATGDVLRVIAFDGAQPEEIKVKIRQGFLEQSNVNLAEEVTELMTAQRAFQLNAKALISADSMMSLANSLRG